MTPLTRYLEWFDDQPDEFRQTIAERVVCMLPEGFFRRKGEDVLDAAKEFRSRIDAMSIIGSIPDAGLALTLSTITDFTLLGSSTESDWEEAKRSNASIVERARSNGWDDFAETMEANLRRFDFRAKVWIRAASKWRTLRDGPLSIIEVDAWMKEQSRNASLM